MVWLQSIQENTRMHAILVAFRAFFRALLNASVRTRIEQALQDEPIAAAPSAPQPAVTKPEPSKKPRRSEALTLLATLQREARLVDFLQEPIESYNDAQIGAAVRDIHRDCRAVLARLFALEPLVPQEEGAAIEVPAGFDAARYSLTGNVSGQPPYRGTLCHHGWLAKCCELPSWTGSDQAAMIVAAAEIELK
jgi:hypothetical protein